MSVLMSKIRNRVFCVAVFCLAFSALTVVPASAQPQVECSSGGYIRISGTFLTDGRDCAGSIVVPSYITEIEAHAFFRNRSLTAITIPASVKKIGRGAFEGTGLTSVVFEEGTQLKEIAPYLFYETFALTSIDIPYGVTSIGNSAFGYSAIVSISIPSSVTAIASTAFVFTNSLIDINVDSQNTKYSSIVGVLFSDQAMTLVRYPSGRSDTTWTIPSSVTRIGDFAFYSTNSLTSIAIPSSVTSIGRHSFAFSTALSTVTIPTSVTTIEGYAFANVSALTNITIPSSVTSIGEAAFAHTSSLTSVNFAEGSQLSTFANHLFYEARSLTYVNIPSSVTSIGEYVFYQNTVLADITIPEGVTSLGSSAFDGMRALTSVTIPDGVTYIGRFTFSRTSITSITIPASVTSIGDDAFFLASSLITVNFLGNAPTTSSSAFAYGHRGLKAYIGPNATGFTAPGTRWNGLVVIGANSNAITYWPNRGSFPADFSFIVVEEFETGKLITAPPPPTREGFTFAGWLDSDTSSRIEFPFIPNSPVDKTLFALWDPLPTSQPTPNPVAPPSPQVPIVDSQPPAENIHSVIPTPKPDSAIQVADEVKELMPTMGVNENQGARVLATRLGVPIASSKAKVTFKVSKSSKQVCTKSGSKLKTLKAGNCVVTFTVQEPKSKKGKKPKATKTVKTLVVQ
jgi:uncharacterized repeat protein (TIGR02543 family)